MRSRDFKFDTKVSCMLKLIQERFDEDELVWSAVSSSQNNFLISSKENSGGYTFQYSIKLFHVN